MTKSCIIKPTLTLYVPFFKQLTELLVPFTMPLGEKVTGGTLQFTLCLPRTGMTG